MPPCGFACCCALEICCVPDSAEARKALADLLKDIPTLASGGTGAAWDVATFIRDNFDLVPKGVGSAIVAGYLPIMKEHLGLKQQQQKSMLAGTSDPQGGAA